MPRKAGWIEVMEWLLHAEFWRFQFVRDGTYKKYMDEGKVASNLQRGGNKSK